MGGSHDFDPAGRRLPIKVDSASNGEFEPRPLSRSQRTARAAAEARVGSVARRLGLSRRRFLTSLPGAASVMLAFNEAHGRSVTPGGYFEVPADAEYELASAQDAIGGDEFIFDIQTHCVDPAGGWAQGADGERWRMILSRVFPQHRDCPDQPYDCFSAQQLVKEVFFDSDTTMAVVSALWGGHGSNPSPTEYLHEARAIAEEMGGWDRLRIHGGVLPNDRRGLSFMDEQAERYGVAAWKLYPQWGPAGRGFYLDDPEFGLPTIEKARALGVKILCVHLGLPLPFLEYEYSDPASLCRAAKRYPDVTFICYHSGYEPDHMEGPYNPAAPQGVDRFIRAYEENGYAPNRGNVYAELGSVWRTYMSQPDAAAHLMGKLVKHLGDERICWGTDALWYGSPQDQIQAFRALQIAETWQERFGYPALTRELKAKILGLNAARVYGIEVDSVRRTAGADRAAALKQAYLEAPNPSFQTFGPKTRREFLRLARKNEPGSFFA